MNKNEKKIASLSIIVNKQTNDKNLWAPAKSLTEAYLQQALTKLHIAIKKISNAKWENSHISNPNHSKPILVTLNPKYISDLNNVVNSVNANTIRKITKSELIRLCISMLNKLDTKEIIDYLNKVQ